MKTFKWNKITEKAAIAVANKGKSFNIGAPIYYGLLEQIEQHYTGQQVKSWWDNAQEMSRKAQEVCKRWDIRRAKALIDSFPHLIPEKYQGLTPIADMDENGDWVLIYE
jgi:hypothetical protein